MFRQLVFTVEACHDGFAAQQYLRAVKGISYTLLKRLKRIENGLLYNGVPIRSIDRISSGGILTLNIPDLTEPPPPVSLPLQIAYEDEDVVVLDKPPFMPVHPARNHQGDTLANALSAYLAENGKDGGFRAVNRLDRDTSGLVAVALNAHAAARMNKNTEKEYLAVVCGTLTGRGTIDLPIRRLNKRATIRVADEEGQRAITHWTSLETYKDYTLISVRLETGRTHQIRVHFSASGHPLVGDGMYGQPHPQLNRQALHCRSLCFIHPVNGDPVEVISPLPADIADFLRSIRQIP